MFNLRLSLDTEPVLWKTSCVVPGPKIGHPSDISRYGSFTLTSHLMKSMERIILGHLMTSADLC